MCIELSPTLMKQKPIVKARAHYGSKSLDITIPVGIVKSCGIKGGDLFTAEVKSENGDLKLVYTRIFQQK